MGVRADRADPLPELAGTRPELGETRPDLRASVHLLLALRNRPTVPFVRRRAAQINGRPGAVFYGPDERPAFVVSLDVAYGPVQTLRAVSNPDKLRHLGPMPGPKDR